MIEVRTDIMGMPIIVEMVGENAAAIAKVFAYFEYVDQTFSTYKENSEISKINRGEVAPKDYSADMKTVLTLCDETEKITDGFFNIRKPEGSLDPSGLVKGWAIWNAAEILKKEGEQNFYISAGGDVQTSGRNQEGKLWSVGIREPFDPLQRTVIKIVHGENLAVATSGTYERGAHIYNPKTKSYTIPGAVSLSVLADNIYEADRFATAAFAMGGDGILFLEKYPGLEGYLVDENGIATMTSGFSK